MTPTRIDVEALDLGRPERNELADPPTDDDLVIDDHVVYSAGRPILYHGQLPDDRTATLIGDWIHRQFDGWQGNLPGSNEFRLSGLKNAHRTFGYTGPVPLRRRWGATSTTFNRDWPRAAYVLERLAEECAAEFARLLPDQYQQHLDTVADIHPGWLIGSSPWTSGIINKSSAMPYHRDSGNVSGSWSAMVVLRRDGNADGGMLHVRDYGVFLRCPDSSISIFDGQGATHGVTPFPPDRGERYSIVFYSKRDVASASPPGEELRRAQTRATAAADQFEEPTS